MQENENVLQLDTLLPLAKSYPVLTHALWFAVFQPERNSYNLQYRLRKQYCDRLKSRFSRLLTRLPHSMKNAENEFCLNIMECLEHDILETDVGFTLSNLVVDGIFVKMENIMSHCPKYQNTESEVPQLSYNSTISKIDSRLKMLEESIKQYKSDTEKYTDNELQYGKFAESVVAKVNNTLDLKFDDLKRHMTQSQRRGSDNSGSSSGTTYPIPEEGSQPNSRSRSVHFKLNDDAYDNMLMSQKIFSLEHIC